MFSNFFKKRAPSGLEYFSSPEGSCFKEWFNNNHSTPKDESKTSYWKVVFDMVVFWSSKMEPIDNPHEGKLTDQQKKIRNEIMAYEFGCWILCSLDNFLEKNKHKDRADIMATFIHNFSQIPLSSFRLNLEDLKKRTISRIIYYKSLKDGNELVPTIAAQITSGYTIEEPSKSVPPENFNMLDFNQIINVQLVMSWISIYQKGAHELFNKIFLSEVCLA